MLTLFIANKNYSSWSLRRWVLMKELNIPFNERLTTFKDSGNQAEFKQFAPNAKVPCLHHNDLVVWDSLAIVEYLAELYPAVWPKDKTARAWARSASAEMHSGFSVVRNICGMNCGIRVSLHEMSESLKNEWQRIDELWNEGLNRFEGPFLAGQSFSAVDAFYAPVVFRMQTFGISLSDVAMKYQRQMLALPSMQQWYNEALAETWRDEPHDAEARAVGDWTADLRAS